ncbi:MAG: acetate--CoA ligase family protein, partial [Micromonosporaceae bacterium]
VRDVVADCAAAGVSGLVVVSAGFAETRAQAQQAGAALQREVVRLARTHGMRVVGPNCFGIANTDPAVRLNASLAPRLPDRGRVGLFTQSGAFGIALLATAASRGLGLSGFVSAGNRSDVSGNDLLQYWRTDPATDVVLLYLETFGNPRKFARLARQLARRKPVVAVASPGSSAASHGAADLFTQHGVIRVDTVGELFDAGLLLSYQPLPGGDRVGVVGNATALGRLAVDACTANGLTVPAGYPVDLGPDAGTDAFAEAIRAAVAAEDTDAIVAVFAPPLATPSGGYADVLVTETQGSDKPVVATFVAPGDAGDDPLARLRKLGPDGSAERGTVPAYPTVEEAVRTLGRACRYARWLREPAGAVPAVPGIAAERARDIVGGHLVDATEATMYDVTAVPLLRCYGVDVVESVAAASGADAVAAAEALGYPVALKVKAPDLRGRLDLGAVRLDLADPASVRRGYADIGERFGSGVEVLVQPMQPPGVACRVRVIQDPAFGPVVGVGLGGATAELLGDEAWRAAPLTDSDVSALVQGFRSAPLLFGYRGAAAVDVPALEELLIRVGLLVDEQPQVRSLELNPVLVAERGLSVLHATVRLSATVNRPDTGPRRLQSLR